eukprot:2694112-Amphidinium_carterae.1
MLGDNSHRASNFFISGPLSTRTGQVRHVLDPKVSGQERCDLSSAGASAPGSARQPGAVPSLHWPSHVI